MENIASLRESSVAATACCDLENKNQCEVSRGEERKTGQKKTRETKGDSRSSEIAVLLSGGVDSSVALKLLVDHGFKVRAYYLKIWLEDELSHLYSCPWEEDLTYAQAGWVFIFICFYC